MTLDKKSIFIILIIALIARCLAWNTGVITFVDSTAYERSALALLNGQWADFYVERTPGYPLLILGVMAVLKSITGQIIVNQWQTAIVTIQTILGMFTAILSAEISYKLFKKPNFALFTGIITAILPDLIFYEHVILSDSLYTFSLVVLVFTAVQMCQTRMNIRSTVWAGILTAWTLWVRQIGFLVSALLLVFSGVFKDAKKSVAFILPVFMTFSLWVGFNWKNHSFLGYTAGSGINQLYKLVDYIDTSEHKSHLAYRKTIVSRAQGFPEYRTYEAVNDAHIIDYLQHQDMPYWKTYLKNDTRSREIFIDTLLTHPIEYLQVTGKEYYKLLFQHTPWDPDIVIWGFLLVTGALGITFYISNLPKATFKNLILSNDAGLLMILILACHLLYPCFSVCEARYRVPLEPLLVIFSLYSIFQITRNSEEAFQNHNSEIKNSGSTTQGSEEPCLTTSQTHWH